MKQLLCYLIDNEKYHIGYMTSVLKNIEQSIEVHYFDICQSTLTSLLQNNQLPDYIFINFDIVKKVDLNWLGLIRHVAAYATIPIIIFSTTSAQRDINSAKDLGASYFFVKTPNFNYVEEKLCDLFHNKLRNFVINQRTDS